MAEEEENSSEENPSEVAEGKTGGGMLKMIIFGVVGLALLGTGIFVGPSVTNMLSSPNEPEREDDKPAPVADGPPIYQSLHPPLIVNLKDAAGDAHYMQITMEVMSREQTVINGVREHTAAVRNALILLYSGSVYEKIDTRSGKEQMLADGLAEIQRVILETTGKSGVEAVYFTALVIQ